MAAFRNALDLDPRLAAAAAEIGYLYIFRFESGARAESMLPEVERWGRRAVQLDPNNSRGWDLLSSTESNPRRALEYSLRAVSVGPRDSFAHNGLALILYQTSARLALEAFRKSMQIDPLELVPAPEWIKRPNGAWASE